MSKIQKAFVFFLIILLPGILFVGWFVIGSSESEVEIDSFEDCVEAGFAVMESYPRQCSDGENTFVEDVEIIMPDVTEENPSEICTDQCGDDICQEVVCLGEGCPCAETIESCPEDCGV